MRRSRSWLIVSVSTLCAACSGQGQDDASAAAVPGDATLGSAGSQAADDHAFANVDCDPAGDGVCENDGDCPSIASGAAREWAANCGTACLGTADEAGCARDCLEAQIGLTDACGECYVQMAVCSREHCLPPCLMAPESRACFDCQIDHGCRATFDACSGLPPATGE